jgi:ATP-dependent DNA helicase RecG
MEHAMKPASLKKLVARGEGPELEFKRSTGELREAMECLCGMLNAYGGGRVLFGVTNDGEIVGQQVAEKTSREIADCSRRIEPAVEVETVLVPVAGGRSVIVVKASGRAQGPFTFDGRGFIRVNNTTQRMSHTEFDRRVVERLADQKPWDTWRARDWSIRDLDEDEIHRAVEDAVDAKRLTGVLAEKTPVVLKRLRLLTEGDLTRAAVILFGRDDGPGHTIGQLRLARFRGTTKDEARDNRQFQGHAFSLLRYAETFLDEHVPVASTFTPGQMRRNDRPLYPPRALREALVNALVHRDYSVDGGAVSVAMFDDRLEVWSTGHLPEGITPAKLKGEHESILRNRLIAGAFHRRGLIEQWGHGTNKILSEAAKGDCPEPEFEEVAGAFVVRFRRNQAAQTELPGVAVPGPRGEKIVAMLRTGGPMTGPQIGEGLGEKVELRTLQRELERLRKAGLVEKVGRTRAAVYRLKAAGR